MTPLFSKADLNKFWHGVQNEVALICAKFGKDLFSISKVIGRKTKQSGPGFLAYPVDPHIGTFHGSKECTATIHNRNETVAGCVRYRGSRVREN